jgi:hypothetical protein
MRQIENFDFDPQNKKNKIRICCLARSLQARSLWQQIDNKAPKVEKYCSLAFISQSNLAKKCS